MDDIEIVLNPAGVRELLRSEEMGAICAEKAQEIAQRAGTGFASDRQTGRNRVSSRVWPETAQAKKDNLQTNTLLKAMK